MKASFRPVALLACVVLLFAAPVWARPAGLKIHEPPSPILVDTVQVGAFPIHVVRQPTAQMAPPDKRSVLILGTFSTSDVTVNASNYINPRTGRPYDVVIGLGDPSKAREAARVILVDHRNAIANARAVSTAIQKVFRGPLRAESIDAHSNGTTVAVCALQQGGAFQGVRTLEIMGPDVGYGGQYVNAASLGQLKSHGVSTVEVHRIRGDVIPSLGHYSETLVNQIPGVSITNHAMAATQAMMGIAAAPPGPGPLVRYHEYPTVGQGQSVEVRMYAEGGVKVAAVMDPGLQAELDRALDMADARQALAILDALMKRCPDVALFYANRGFLRAGQGDAKGAFDDYARAVSLDPGLAVTYANRADLHGAQKNYQAAVDDNTQMLTYNPTYWKGYFQRGTLYGLMGRNEQALSDFTEAIKRRPGNAKAYRYRAIAYRKLGRLAEAQADLETAHRLEEK